MHDWRVGRLRAEAWIETQDMVGRPARGASSPPARRRGLKTLRLRFESAKAVRRPPARRRGLKHLNDLKHLTAGIVASRAEAWIETMPEGGRFRSARCGSGGSPPARRRGLKRDANRTLTRPAPVASRAEAWIETAWRLRPNIWASVASRAEAWIETLAQGTSACARGSPPARRRGLKLRRDE